MDLPLLLCTFIFITILSYKLYKRLRFKLPPSPRPWPVVGNLYGLYHIKPVRFRCFAEWSQFYGHIISVWFGSSLYVIVSNSELAEEVLKQNDQHLANRHLSPSAAQFSREGNDLVWADYGPHYVKDRKVCTLELFSLMRLEALRPIREDEVTAMIESIYKDCTSPDKMVKKTLLVKKYLVAVAFNNITRLVLGKRFVNNNGVTDEHGLEFSASIANGRKLGASLSMAEHIPWLRWMFPLEKEALAQHGAHRDRLTRTIMEEHTLTRQKTGRAKQHFVDALLTLQDNMILVRTLLWPALVLDPPLVAKEALRLHPPTPLMLPHRANANVKVGGYDIPKGSIVNVNVWAIVRDPTIWKNPLEFQPERFFEEDVDMKGHDFRLLPFGAGRRVCPGAQLGINLVTSMLDQLLHHFSWAPPNELKPEEIHMGEIPGLITYMRTPIHAIPTPRLPSHLYKCIALDM